MKIAFLPIDNRPVCYTLAKDIADIDKSIELYIPPREFLGDLTKSADIEKLISWLENLPKVDSMILSLDTLVYGGLTVEIGWEDFLGVSIYGDKG